MFKPTITLTDKEARTKILEQAYRILSEIGHDVYCPEAVEIFKNGGCSVEGTRVKIPREVIEKCLATAPKMIEIYDRNGNKAMDLGGMNTYYGPGPTCPNYFDPKTGERRPATKQDAATTALISDALPNIDFVMSLVMIGDRVKDRADIDEVDAMVRNTTKPLCSWTFSKENLQTIIDMASVVAGGLDKLQEKPFLIIYAEPTTPMKHVKEALDKVILLAQNRVPVIYTPGMIMGATAPVTISAALSLGISETLVGLVLSQLVNPGAPFIAGVGGGPLDMRTMQHSYGAPEWPLIMCSQTEILHEIELPVFSGAAASDSKCVDGQATAEAMAQVIFSMGTGGNLNHDVGFMDLGLTGSPLYLVIGDELIGFARRIFEGGVPVDDEAMGFEVLEQVGPGGNFLTEDHTLDNYEDAIWVPTLFDRRVYQDWEADGATTMTERAQAKMERILKNHKPEPLPEDVCKKLDELVG